jgi:lysophospholipase L1-like esterase
MSALEVILTCILGTIAGIISIGILVLHALQQNKVQNMDILNRFAHKGGIVFFGDSLTDFFPLQEFFTDLRLYNRGIANDMTKDLHDRIQNVTDLCPSKLFLLIGTNDLGNLVRPHKILSNIDKILEKVKESNPNVKIYIISQIPVSITATFFSFVSLKFRNNKKLKELSDMQENYCKEKGYTFINVWPHLIDQRGRLKREYTIEGLHLTMEGYAVMANILKPYIYE